MENKISDLELEPVSAEELKDYYGFTGCPYKGEKGPYDPDCCWHDCKKKNGMGSKFWTGRN